MEMSLRELVPSDAAALAHILISANEAVFRGRVPDRCLEFTEAESAANWGRFFAQGIPTGDFMLGVQGENGQLVAYAWASAFDDAAYRGELRQIMVLPAFQQQGLGKRLLCRVVQRLLDVEISSLRVDVLQVNPSREFYAHMGGTIIAEGSYDWDGVMLPQLTYGWTDTRSIGAQHCSKDYFPLEAM